jgi:hypothetical protein
LFDSEEMKAPHDPEKLKARIQQAIAENLEEELSEAID